MSQAISEPEHRGSASLLRAEAYRLDARISRAKLIKASVIVLGAELLAHGFSREGSQVIGWLSLCAIGAYTGSYMHSRLAARRLRRAGESNG